MTNRIDEEVIREGDFAVWNYTESKVEDGIALLQLLGLMKSEGYKVLDVPQKFGMSQFLEDFDLENSIFFEKESVEGTAEVPEGYR